MQYMLTGLLYLSSNDNEMTVSFRIVNKFPDSVGIDIGIPSTARKTSFIFRPPICSIFLKCVTYKSVHNIRTFP